jgi:hypothetical protein
MGQQRIRRKKRRGFRKPDAVIVTLTSLTIILLLVWGGLYWKESSERALIAQTNGKVDEQPSATGETVTVTPVEQSNEKPGVTDEVPQLPEAAKPTQETVMKPETQTPTKSESPGVTETKSPSATVIKSPSTKQSDPPITKAQNYDQEITQIQAICTKDMKEVLSGAESSIQQLDKTDPVAVQALKVKLMNEIVAAEYKCDVKFQEVTQKAESDSVSPKVIAEWKQTFSAMKEKLREESRAKLQQLMGG